MIRFVWSRLFRRACSSFVSVKNTDKKQQKGHDKKKHEKTAGEHKEQKAPEEKSKSTIQTGSTASPTPAASSKSEQNPTTESTSNPFPNPPKNSPSDPPQNPPYGYSSSSQSDNEYAEQQPYVRQNRRTYKWLAYRCFVWGSLSLVAYNIYLLRNSSKDNPAQNSKLALPLIYDLAKITNDAYNDVIKMISEPPRKKLLPDPIHPLIQPKTLVLNLSGTLIKTDFIFGKGMSIKVRPGLKNMLYQLAQKYEIVVFSDDDYNFIIRAQPFVDPDGMFIANYFGKECMSWEGGANIKDLKYLNRDLRKVVVIDRSKNLAKKHGGNVIVLPQYTGSDDDRQLMKLLCLLEKLAPPNVPDVRAQLHKYGDNPVEAYYNLLQLKQKKMQEKSQSGVLSWLFPKKKPELQQKPMPKPAQIAT